MTTGSNEELRGLPMKWRERLNRCVGYPVCDGDLPGEAHEKECPEYGRSEYKPIRVMDCIIDLEAALPKSSPAPVRQPDLVIQRLPDWNWAAFLNETDASCIAIGATEQEALNNGMRELLSRYTKSSPDALTFYQWWHNCGYRYLPAAGEPPEHAAIAELAWNAALAAPSSLIEGLRELEALSKKATEGPWRYSKWKSNRETYTRHGIGNPVAAGQVLMVRSDASGEKVDWKFMVACVNYVRKLLEPQVGPVSAPPRDIGKEVWQIIFEYRKHRSDCQMAGAFIGLIQELAPHLALGVGPVSPEEKR